MIEFRDTLTGLIDEYGAVEEDQFELPKPAMIGDKRTKQVSLIKISRNKSLESKFILNCIRDTKNVSFFSKKNVLQLIFGFLVFKISRKRFQTQP